MSNRVWTIHEIEGGFTVNIQTELPGQRGVLSQFIERHAVSSIQEATQIVIKDFRLAERERKE